MKHTARYLLASLALCAAGVGVALVHSSAAARRHLVTCSSLCVEFADSLHLLGEDDIKAQLEKNCPVYLGSRIDSVNLSNIERTLNACGAIRSSQAWITSDGVLHVGITQRKPVALLKDGAKSFFVDSEGFIFPEQGLCTGVPVIEGELPVRVQAGYKGLAPTPEGREWMSSLLRMLDYMKHSRRWADRFEAIKVRAGGDLVLLPREGSETFIYGRPGGDAAKFARIAAYYENIAPAMQDGGYKTVNVKYKGQIVCRKKK